MKMNKAKKNNKLIIGGLLLVALIAIYFFTKKKDTPILGEPEKAGTADGSLTETEKTVIQELKVENSEAVSLALKLIAAWNMQSGAKPQGHSPKWKNSKDDDKTAKQVINEVYSKALEPAAFVEAFNLYSGGGSFEEAYSRHFGKAEKKSTSAAFNYISKGLV